MLLLALSAIVWRKRWRADRRRSLVYGTAVGGDLRVAKGKFWRRLRRRGTRWLSSAAGQPPSFRDTSEIFVLLVYIRVCKFRSPVFTARSVAVRRRVGRGGGSGHSFGAAVSVVVALRRGQFGERGQARYGCLPSSGANAVAVARMMPKPVVAVLLLFKRKNEPPRERRLGARMLPLPEQSIQYVAITEEP